MYFKKSEKVDCDLMSHNIFPLPSIHPLPKHLALLSLKIPRRPTTVKFFKCFKSYLFANLLHPLPGVTVFRPHMSVETPLPTESPDTSTEVPYHGADKAQIKELVKRSAYCYQGVRFDCFNTSVSFAQY